MTDDLQVMSPRGSVFCRRYLDAHEHVSANGELSTGGYALGSLFFSNLYFLMSSGIARLFTGLPIGECRNFQQEYWTAGG